MRSSSRTDGCAASRRWVVLAALLGLLAMHGLATHGTSHRAHVSESMAPVSAEHIGSPMAEAGAATGPTASRSPYVERDNGPGGASALCLAVLLAGIGLAVLLGRRRGVVRARGASPAAFGHPARARRDRDPPCLFTLSVQRC
ncbi:DUF6153 family protein [Nocardioides sp.]|uniref:DUF6153 family protein n=1 Tax=Nocardioides sp. TaxID=35761 RepID=UPI002EDA0577